MKKEKVGQLQDPFGINYRRLSCSWTTTSTLHNNSSLLAPSVSYSSASPPPLQPAQRRAILTIISLIAAALIKFRLCEALRSLALSRGTFR